MRCSWSEERFEALLDGTLLPAERARVLAHVDGCYPCGSLLAELRVVDALLLAPRAVEPAPNFTFKTMAEIRAIPLPQRRRPAFTAYLVCYLVAAWLLIVAGVLLEPRAMRAWGETAIDIAVTVMNVLGGVGRVVAHVGDRGDLGTWATFAGGVVVADLALVAALVAAVRFAPRVVERQRS